MPEEQIDLEPAKSLLEYKKEKKPFEAWLMDKYGEDYFGEGSDFKVCFDEWVGNLDYDSLIDLGNEFAKKLLVYLGNK